MQSRALEVLVGFFVCLGVAAIFGLTFRVASLNRVGGEHGSYEITAKFDTIGSLAPGKAADLIAVKGDPLKDVAELRRVTSVIKGGVVYK